MFVRPFVRLSGHSLSRAPNLHLSGFGLSQDSLRSLLGLSQVTLRFLSVLSQVTLRSLL